MIELARRNASAIAAGHSFIIFLGEGFYPLNVLNAVKMVPEVCRVLRNGQSDAGGAGGNGTGARHPGRRGRLFAQGRRRRARRPVAEMPLAEDRV